MTDKPPPLVDEARVKEIMAAFWEAVRRLHPLTPEEAEEEGGYEEERDYDY